MLYVFINLFILCNVSNSVDVLIVNTFVECNVLLLVNPLFDNE